MKSTNIFILFFFLPFIILIEFNPELIAETHGQDIYLIPKERHTQTLIFLHGLGQSPQNFIVEFYGDKTPVPPQTKVILLSSPIIPIQIFKKATVHSWFNIYSLRFNENDYEMNDVCKAAERIFDIIESEAALLQGNYKRIFVGGFSQGAIISIHIGLNFNNLIGGVIALSGILLPESRKGVDLSKKEDLPCFIARGLYDDKKPLDEIRATFEPIMHFKNIELHEYDMNHEITDYELKDVRKFIEKRLVLN